MQKRVLLVARLVVVGTNIVVEGPIKRQSSRETSVLPPFIKASRIVDGNAIVILGPIHNSQKARYGQSAKCMII